MLIQSFCTALSLNYIVDLDKKPMAQLGIRCNIKEIIQAFTLKLHLTGYLQLTTRLNALPSHVIGEIKPK